MTTNLRIGVSNFFRLFLGLTALALSANMDAISFSAVSVATDQEKSCVLPDRVDATRPDPNATPTRVMVGLRLIDLAKITDFDESMTIDVYLRERWTDRRLAPFEGCFFQLHEVWNPGIISVNSGEISPVMRDEVEVGPNGAVTYSQRYRGALYSPRSLADFPFDETTLRLSLMSLKYGDNEVQLVVDEPWTGRRKTMSVSDWAIGPVMGRVGIEYVELSGQNHSRYDFEIDGRRHSGYYVGRGIIPLVLIVLMSFTVFWISPVQFGTQTGIAAIGISATSMLTLIAFQLAIGNLLPIVNYYTRMDLFILGSTILVFLSLVEAVCTAFLVGTEKKGKALRLDKISRWVFPIAFICLGGYAFLL